MTQTRVTTSPTGYRKPLICSAIAILVILICIRIVDAPLARWTWGIGLSHPAWLHRIKDIPNTLPALTAVGTATLWLSYFVFSLAGLKRLHARFALLAGLAVPAAYLAKLFLQPAFGRTNIRLWLKTGVAIEFRWFHPLENGGFPSGHTIVITALLAAVWLCYPRLRPLAATIFVALFLALIATSSHFVSDIIAGACCGILITCVVDRLLAQCRSAASPVPPPQGE